MLVSSQPHQSPFRCLILEERGHPKQNLLHSQHSSYKQWSLNECCHKYTFFWTKAQLNRTVSDSNPISTCGESKQVRRWEQADVRRPTYFLTSYTSGTGTTAFLMLLIPTSTRISAICLYLGQSNLIKWIYRDVHKDEQIILTSPTVLEASFKTSFKFILPFRQLKNHF